MAASRIRTALLVAVPLIILMLPLSIYFLDSAAASDRVARNVSIAGVDVARFTKAEAVDAIDAYTADLTAHTSTVEVNGEQFQLDPASVGLTFGTDAAIESALELRKDGITDWLRAFSDAVEVSLT
ncbi:MAG: hypothetical protein ACR2N9_00955, partial [Acidimicrobiia bacterium]